jgi:hypothetical protein
VELVDAIHFYAMWAQPGGPTGHMAEHLKYDLIPELLAEFGAALDLATV